MIRLSDSRVMIKRGTQTYYVKCETPPKEAGEGWNAWDRMGPPGSEPEKGVYVVDTGEERIRVRAWDWEGALSAALDEAIASIVTGNTIRAPRPGFVLTPGQQANPQGTP